MNGELLWEPFEERIKETNMYRFMQTVNQKHGMKFENYSQLYQWSINNIPDFWADMWEEADIIASSDFDEVIDDITKMPGAKWFSGARLNFAQNLLRYRDDHIALVFKGEAMDECQRITYAQLYDNVARLARRMRNEGITKGDRVAGFMPNMPETVMAMLACASIGAIWSSCSPDFGTKGALDRFGQIRPKLLFTASRYSYNGKWFDSLVKVTEIHDQLPIKPRIIVVPYGDEKPDISSVPNSFLLSDFISDKSGLEIEFEQLPFDHPLYIMYSSGTTGLPKSIVHSSGGILINHIKELKLHTDVKRDDILFYYTTCGWMMWNWMASALSLGCTIVLFDGSPFYPDARALLRLVGDEKITIFGTSAKYIDSIQKEGLKPEDKYDTESLKTILSTGSPLSDDNFRFVYRDIRQDVCLSSISGGTDLNGCFFLGNPMGAVYAGELQCAGLGMNVKAYDEEGISRLNYQGELVCESPFPSMPLYFWNDPKGEKYHNAYFDVYPGIWRHGDFIKINDHGGVVIFGRSDATLNPGGVRIGTAEIYRVVEAFDEIEDSLVIGQEWKGDVRVVLFVKLCPGSKLNDDLVKKIRTAIKTNCSPRHVPAKVIQISDIPYTINMKKVEMAVKNIIHGKSVMNRESLRNPESLDVYKDIQELKN
ncbi:MAG: acetoacetate--CoA ligase [Candidatus Methanoperedens sp.]|nr:acetoacetate--CoA ligase [Candidatus Methanoperedens sp.]